MPKKILAPIVAMLLGSLLFHATTAHAARMVVSTLWTLRSDGVLDPNFTVETEAFFDPANLSGVGVVVGQEAVQIEVFELMFSNRDFPQTAEIRLGPAPYPEASLIAIYVAGSFDHFGSVNHGGNNQMSIIPTTPPFTFGEHITLGLDNVGDNILTNFGFRREYLLTSSTGPVLVIPEPVIPEPSTLTIWTIGTLGMLGYRWRRRKQAA